MALINTAEKYGDAVTVGMLIDGSIPEYRDDMITSIRDGGFRNCNKLIIVDLPKVTSIGKVAFDRATALDTVILRNADVVVTLVSALPTACPIYKGTGYIYVPAALVDSYKAATNWSTYADQFRALEDYTVDGTVTGELDWDKINAAA